MISVVSRVRLAGIAAAVPRRNEPVIESGFRTAPARLKFMESTGIEDRRVCAPGQCASDLAGAAAERLLDDLNWDRGGIDFVVMVTQTPDYLLPATAITLQDRLGLPRSAAAFDINLGCSGYPYALAVTGGMISGAGFRRGLLLVGDTSTRGVLPSEIPDRPPLFGDAATATALEWSAGAPDMHIDLGSDGSGFAAIMQRHGGHRHPFTRETFRHETAGDGTVIVDNGFVLDGLGVLNFSVREAPPSVRRALASAGLGLDDIDAFVLHQANRAINELVCRKLGIPPGKAPSTLRRFGNTSSASIPLTIVSELAGRARSGRLRLLLCGFGVGLSWASAVCTVERIACPELVEL